MKTVVCLQFVIIGVVLVATSPIQPEQRRSVVREKRAPLILGKAALGLAAVGGLGIAGAAIGKTALVGGALGLGAAKFYGGYGYGYHGPHVYHHYPSVRYYDHYHGYPYSGHRHYGFGYGYGYGYDW